MLSAALYPAAQDDTDNTPVRFCHERHHRSSHLPTTRHEVPTPRPRRLDFRQTVAVINAPIESQPTNYEAEQPLPAEGEGGGEATAAFNEFAETVLRVPWGSLAKSELEFQVFRLLVAQKRIDLAVRDSALAGKLEITPARVRALRFKWDQREKAELTVGEMLAQIIPHALNDTGDELIIRIDSGYVLDRVVDELRSGERPVLVRSLRTVGHVQVDVIDFWIKVNALVGMSEEDLDALRSDLLKAFPRRVVTKPATRKVFGALTHISSAAQIASLLHDITAPSTATG